MLLLRNKAFNLEIFTAQLFHRCGCDVYDSFHVYYYAVLPDEIFLPSLLI